MGTCISPTLATSRWPQLLGRTPVYPFHSTAKALIIKPFLLADIGEGIRECEVIQWFVEPEARVEQFDKLCEVQSDKASVEITSRFDGVIKKLHYDAGQMAEVGKPLVDIDIQSEISPEDEAITTVPAEQAGEPASAQQPQKAVDQPSDIRPNEGASHTQQAEIASKPPRGKHATLATPAVRHLTKELTVDLAQITGTGRDGRVLKDDVHKYATQRDNATRKASQIPSIRSRIENGPQKEEVITLTHIQSQMFKTMTRSLSIPHFLYADEVDLRPLQGFRTRLNTYPTTSQRISILPFIIKAVSLALDDFPLLNARVDSSSEADRPNIVLRSQHNIGIAMDTPQGLIVPNIKNVASKSITSISAELKHLKSLAMSAKLSSADLTGGTITVSNIGSIGGTYVAPVIVSSEVAILGIGKARIVPRYNEKEELIKSEIANFSWSADHRVIDGATMARMAERVRGFVEVPETMFARLQ
ncbi:MAG: hypothetical protein M1836_003138 [Candelina mexicana]|nr:MAG: hypothetical protein M1836_003138 [Candelina mexicana]